MDFDPDALAKLTRKFQPKDYLRCTPVAHRSTPLGMGYGNTRFASPTNSFRLLYIAEDLPTCIAETVIRDRFEGTTKRELMQAEIAIWGACEVQVSGHLRLVDLRRDGCFKLGISTDIAGAKAHDEAQAFSQKLYDATDLDGIIYYSRLRNRECMAIYDRAVSLHLTSSDVVELERLANLATALRSLQVQVIA